MFLIEYSTYTNLCITLMMIYDNIHIDRFETLVWSKERKHPF